MFNGFGHFILDITRGLEGVVQPHGHCRYCRHRFSWSLLRQSHRFANVSSKSPVALSVPFHSRCAILDKSSVNLQTRSAAWQDAGWSIFDAANRPLAPDDIRRERELYGADLPRG
jgi:hypothetical protein